MGLWILILLPNGEKSPLPCVDTPPKSKPRIGLLPPPPLRLVASFLQICELLETALYVYHLLDLTMSFDSYHLTKYLLIVMEKSKTRLLSWIQQIVSLNCYHYLS